MLYFSYLNGLYVYCRAIFQFELCEGIKVRNNLKKRDHALKDTSAFKYLRLRSKVDESVQLNSDFGLFMGEKSYYFWIFNDYNPHEFNTFYIYDNQTVKTSFFVVENKIEPRCVQKVVNCVKKG